MFFGRTSSGKSSVINALLGEKILPSGLGHTTACFVKVRGIPGDEPALVDLQSGEAVAVGDLRGLVHALSDDRLGPGCCLDLQWPRDRCSLLTDDDVVLVDSPGVDVEADFDDWIDRHCLDADLFVLVVNSESTLMMREKAFFTRVAAKLAKPNILVLLNRWDCASQEEEYLIHAAHDQHVSRTCDFLVNELKVAANDQDAASQVFFVSAKEALDIELEKKQGAGGGNQTPKSRLPHAKERLEEWARFKNYIGVCMETAALGARFGPHIDAGRSVAAEINVVQSSFHKVAVDELDAKVKAKSEVDAKIEAITSDVETLTGMFKMQIKQVLSDVDELVRNGFYEEMDNLNSIVYDFHAPFANDPLVIKVYKQSLIKHLQAGFAQSLKLRLAQQVFFMVEEAKVSMRKRMNQVGSQEGIFVEDTFVSALNNSILDDLEGMVDYNKIFEDFQEDVSFHFSLAPGKLVSHSRRLYRTIHKFWADESATNHRNHPGYANPQDNDSNAVNEAKHNSSDEERHQDLNCLLRTYANQDTNPWSWAKIFLASIVTTETSSQLACAGLAMRYLGNSRSSMRLVFSIGLVYSALYAVERFTWTQNAQERQLKRQAVAFAARRLPIMEPYLVSRITSQVQNSLTSMVAQSLASMEKSLVDLKETREKLGDEIEGLEATLKSCANLSNSIQGVLFDFDNAEQTLHASI